MASEIRQNYDEECEAAINRHVNGELHSSYHYQAMAAHFNRDDVALPGFQKFFEEMSAKEKEHADKFLKYQNTRGGRVVLQDIKAPHHMKWNSGLMAMQLALELEQKSNKSLLDLHQIAEKHNDSQLCDFIEGEFMKQKVDTIKLLGDYVSKLALVGPGLGEYTFDKETLQD